MNTDVDYPPAPWRLVGESIQALRLVPIEVARQWVPDTLSIVPVAPGKTLGALYFAHYDAKSTLSYHELIVAPALTRVGRHVGFWISHIYVDLPTSLRGGREIWGLNKELATFRWLPQQGIAEAHRDGANLCRIEWKPRRLGLPLPIWAPLLSHRAEGLHDFRVVGRVSASVTPARIAVSDTAPFAAAGFSNSRYAAQSRLNLRISAPRGLQPKRGPPEPSTQPR